jgi:hypothetical protein
VSKKAQAQKTARKKVQAQKTARKKAQAQKTARKKAQAQKTARKNVTSTVVDFFFFSVFLTDVLGKKITINLKELHRNRKRRNKCTTEKS